MVARIEGMNGINSNRRIIIVSDSLPYAYRLVKEGNSGGQMNNITSSSLSTGPLSPPAIFNDPELRSSSIRPRRRSRGGGHNFRKSMTEYPRSGFCSLSSLSIANSSNGSSILGASPKQSLELVTRTNHAAYWVASNLDNPIIHVGKSVFLPNETDESNAMIPNREELCSLYQEKACRPVFVDSKVAEGHWDGYCRSCLWPLFHYTLWEGSIDTHCRLAGQFQQYSAVNEAFADEIVKIWSPDDVSIPLCLFLR